MSFYVAARSRVNIVNIRRNTNQLETSCGHTAKIGIVTFHRSYNFGSALQAFALQMSLERLNYCVTIIDIRSRDKEQYKLLSIKHPRHTARVLSRLNRYLARRNSFERFFERRYRLTSQSYTNKSKLGELSDHFDAFICGSDQIWNLDCTGGVVEPFFLSFAGDRRRVAYAPSLAHTSFRPENFDKDKVAELLAKFDYLSVREEETVPLFQPLVDKKIEVVLDPTLLLDADAYTDMAKDRVADSPYVFVYLLRSCPELVESARAMARTADKEVVYISEKNLPIPNSTNLFGVGPEEFVSLIAHADAVLTNSFHATVFSILFHRPFRVFATDKSASRMQDLTAKLDMPGRCIKEIDASPLGDEDWNMVDRKLDELRKGSWGYLQRALS